MSADGGTLLLDEIGDMPMRLQVKLLNAVHIEMPSLSRRREDIALLVAHFLAQIARESAPRWPGW